MNQLRAARFTSRISLFSFLAFLPGPFFLTGCGGNFSALPNVNITGQTPIGSLQGSTFGGQQPVAYSHVYLMAASKAGYGTASTSILTASSNTTPDTTLLGTPANPAYYVVTDGGGNFNITGDYTCNHDAADPAESDQLYILSLQGNATYMPTQPVITGGVNNPMIGLMATLGQCPSTGTLVGTVPFIYVNEISTVATAYALAGFASTSTSVASGSSLLAQTGLANAFANAGQLYDISGSQPYHEARLTTPGSGTSGTVPQALLDTLGNILATCVNANNTTAVPASGPCYTLYSNTGSPINTADAILYIAQHPGKNVANLYGMQTGIVQFADDLPSQPKDFTVGINFSGTGLTTPVDVAIDASGDAWVTSTTGNVSKLTPLGTQTSGSPFTMAPANYLAIDQNGNAYVSSAPANDVAEFNGTGSFVSGTPYTNLDFVGPAGVASDGNGNVIVANPGGSGLLNVFGVLGDFGDLIKISGSGSGATQTINSQALLYAGSEFNLLPSVSQVALDSQGYVWVSGDNVNCLALVLCTGQNVARLSETSFATATLSFMANIGPCVLLFCTNEAPQGIAIDSGDNGWVAIDGTTAELGKLTSAGALTTYTGGGLSSPKGVAIDGAGNVWLANSGNNSLSEFTSAGVAVTGTSGYTGGTLSLPTRLDVDGSGNVWVVNSTGNSVTEILGAAAPVVRPLASAVVGGTLGTRPQ
jgi:streptogramin lyase